MNTQELALLANSIREDIVRMITNAKSGHTAGSLGMADVFTVLYFKILKHNPKKPLDENRDYLLLSNGHICPVLYATLARAGYFPKEELLTFRKIHSRLQGHPHVLHATNRLFPKKSLPGVENSGGPLGQGTSQSCGIALGLLRTKNTRKQFNKTSNQQSNHVYCIIGDGELDEGQCWEAAMFASHNKLSNLTWIVDQNNIQIDGFTTDVLNHLDLGNKFRSFGWNVIKVSGHDIDGLIDSLHYAKELSEKNMKPTVLLAKTIPGRGVATFENDYRWHGKAPNDAECKQALVELEKISSHLKKSLEQEKGAAR